MFFQCFVMKSVALMNIPHISFDVQLFAFLLIIFVEWDLFGHRLCVCLALSKSFLKWLYQLTPSSPTRGVGVFALLQIYVHTLYFQSFKTLAILMRL